MAFSAEPKMIYGGGMENVQITENSQNITEIGIVSTGNGDDELGLWQTHLCKKRTAQKEQRMI